MESYCLIAGKSFFHYDVNLPGIEPSMAVWSNRYSYHAPPGYEADLQLLDFGGMTIDVQYLKLAAHRLPDSEDGNCNVMHV
jgi:hypothetical protein